METRLRDLTGVLRGLGLVLSTSSRQMECAVVNELLKALKASSFEATGGHSSSTAQSPSAPPPSAATHSTAAQPERSVDDLTQPTSRTSTACNDVRDARNVTESSTFASQRASLLHENPAGDDKPISSSKVSPTDSVLISSNPLIKMVEDQETIQDYEVHLSDKSKERAVPASKLQRLWQYGGLAMGLGVDAVVNAARNTVSRPSNTPSSFLFTEAAANRLVESLCRMRGAALKLGQIISLQDNSAIPEPIQQIFERVRQSADFMPARQVETQMQTALGSEWRNKFIDFDMKPFAAASLGQVHRALTTKDELVAVKVQYPGVAESIDSDVASLSYLLLVSKLLPEGLFLETLLKSVRSELTWEVDYLREADYMRRFHEALADDHKFVVPLVYPELSSNRVLTSQFVRGMPLEKTASLSQATRNDIGSRILSLCLRELFELKFMQTDPNWSNFLYNPKADQIALLDFGASRDFGDNFTDLYLSTIECAANNDRDGVIKYSKLLGYFTGDEMQIMIDAHTETVLLLGRPFAINEPFDFQQQDISSKVRQYIPTMLKYRLTPPPVETYSLHRKLSGAFLLCAKLGASVNCRPIFEHYSQQYWRRRQTKNQQSTS